MALKARLKIASHLFGSCINCSALWAIGGAIGNALAASPWWLAFLPGFYAPALALGLIYGLATMPVYVLVVNQ